jgi:hypothetical protein
MASRGVFASSARPASTWTRLSAEGRFEGAVDAACPQGREARARLPGSSHSSARAEMKSSVPLSEARRDAFAEETVGTRAVLPFGQRAGEKRPRREVLRIPGEEGRGGRDREVGAARFDGDGQRFVGKRPVAAVRQGEGFFGGSEFAQRLEHRATRMNVGRHDPFKTTAHVRKRGGATHRGEEASEREASVAGEGEFERGLFPCIRRRLRIAAAFDFERAAKDRGGARGVEACETRAGTRSGDGRVEKREAQFDLEAHRVVEIRAGEEILGERAGGFDVAHRVEVDEARDVVAEGCETLFVRERVSVEGDDDRIGTPTSAVARRRPCRRAPTRRSTKAAPRTRSGARRASNAARKATSPASARGVRRERGASGAGDSIGNGPSTVPPVRRASVVKASVASSRRPARGSGRTATARARAAPDRASTSTGVSVAGTAREKPPSPRGTATSVKAPAVMRGAASNPSASIHTAERRGVVRSVGASAEAPRESPRTRSIRSVGWLASARHGATPGPRSSVARAAVRPRPASHAASSGRSPFTASRRSAPGRSVAAPASAMDTGPSPIEAVVSEGTGRITGKAPDSTAGRGDASGSRKERSGSRWRFGARVEASPSPTRKILKERRVAAGADEDRVDEDAAVGHASGEGFERTGFDAAVGDDERVAESRPRFEQRVVGLFERLVDDRAAARLQSVQRTLDFDRVRRRLQRGRPSTRTVELDHADFVVRQEPLDRESSDFLREIDAGSGHRPRRVDHDDEADGRIATLFFLRERHGKEFADSRFRVAARSETRVRAGDEKSRSAVDDGVAHGVLDFGGETARGDVVEHDHVGTELGRGREIEGAHGKARAERACERVDAAVRTGRRPPRRPYRR